MFTVVPRESEVTHPPKTEIIDHNAPAKLQTPTWKKGKHSGNISYDTLKEQRDKLIEAEKKYRTRIKELESENAELSKTYEATYQENKMLKGIIQHGPDASKVKELRKVEKEQRGTIGRLEEENEILNKRLNEVEEVYNARGQTAESTWNELLAKLKQKRPRGEKVPTQGPFARHTQANALTVFNQKQDVDDFDRHLDNLEKETQILLNKIHQLQSEKEQIGSAIDKEKGYITRNAAMNNALNEKLNRDLNQFAMKLEKMKLKHKTARAFAGLTGKVGHKHAFSFESPEPGENASLSSALVPLPGKIGYTPTVPPSNSKTVEMKSPKLNNALQTVALQSPKLNNTQKVKSVEMQSPKLDMNIKTIEMKSPKQFPNGKTQDADNLKPRNVVSSSKKQESENQKGLTDQLPQADNHVRTSKVKQSTPKLNKVEEGKEPNSTSRTETNTNAAKSINGLNGSRVTISKTEKQTVITFSPASMANTANQTKGTMSSNAKKTMDNKSKRDIPSGLIEEMIAETDEKKSLDETRSGNVKNDNATAKRKSQATAKQPVNENMTEMDDAESVIKAKEFFTKGNGSQTGGRYTNGPEPIPRKFIDPEKKTYRYSDMYSKRKENFEKVTGDSADNNMNFDESGIKLNFTDKARYATIKINSEPKSTYKYGFPVRKNSKHIEDEAPNDAVLTYLRNRPNMNENPVTFKEEYADAKDKGSPSPMPIVFNDDAKTVGSDEIKFILTAKRPSYGSVYG